MARILSPGHAKRPSCRRRLSILFRRNSQHSPHHRALCSGTSSPPTHISFSIWESFQAFYHRMYISYVQNTLEWSVLSIWCQSCDRKCPSIYYSSRNIFCRRFPTRSNALLNFGCASGLIFNGWKWGQSYRQSRNSLLLVAFLFHRRTLSTVYSPDRLDWSCYRRGRAQLREQYRCWLLRFHQCSTSELCMPGSYAL